MDEMQQKDEEGGEETDWAESDKAMRTSADV